MKNKKTILSILSALIVSALLTFNAQANPKGDESSTFKVYGNCGMCKSRIESSLKVKGVSKAAWDAQSKMLTVSYDPKVISLDEVHKIVAGVGHDTEKVSAEGSTYNNLMGCCQYSRKK